LKYNFIFGGAIFLISNIYQKNEIRKPKKNAVGMMERNLINNDGGSLLIEFI
jgi:hypothetical protein